MNNRIRIALLLITVLLCFGLGMFTVLLNDPQKPSVSEPEELQKQRVGLVVGVDSFDADKPELLAIWQIVYFPIEEELFLLGILPNSPAPGHPELRLRDLFGLTSGGEPSKEFLAEFDGDHFFRPDAVIVLDEVAFSALIDYLAGVDIRGAELQGTQVIEILRALRNDWENSLALQVEVLTGLTNRLPSLDENPDLTPLVALLPEHGFLSLPPFRMMTLFGPTLSLQPDRIYVAPISP